MRYDLVSHAARGGRDLLYLTLGLASSILALAVWIAGVSVSLSTGLLVVGLPLVLASALAFRACATLDRRNAAVVLGRAVPGRYRRPERPGFLARLKTTLADVQTWRDLTWLMLHSVLGLAFGIAAVSLVASVLGLAVLPAWYWALPDGAQLGLWTADSLLEALLTALLALPLAVLTLAALRAMAAGEAKLAVALLGPPPRF